MVNLSTDCTYEELSHTAEIGMSVHAKTAAGLFVCAAHSMFTMVQARPDRATEPMQQTFEVESIDAESLLVDWLGELLYWFEINGAAPAEYTDITWTPLRLVAQVISYRLAAPPAMHIKAVTYHQLLVQETQNEWVAQVYFDI